MTRTPARKPLALIILDGFGYSERTTGNAIALARKPNFDRLWWSYPHTLIDASSERVGLPHGQMGNSEVGHMNMGAGRVVQMDISRIDCAIEDGSFFRNPVLLEAVRRAKERGTKLHLMGLLSDGGVHSMNTHLYSLLVMSRDERLDRVFVHCFLDGRDTPPESGAGYVEALQKKLEEIGTGLIASIAGRYYAMDRDKRWDRVEQAYRMMVEGVGRLSDDGAHAVQESYGEGVTDEFVKPVVLTNADGRPVATIDDGDSVIFFNFRADRAREITRALTEKSFDGFARQKFPAVHFACMTQYDATFPLPFAFKPQTHREILAEILAEHHIKNLRVAETEKYAHVTFFFNGGVEKSFDGESRILIPSPKVATYNLQPEMSAPKVTDEICRAIDEGTAGVLIVNFANSDMVGHTGIVTAAVRAIETIDASLGMIYQSIRKAGGVMIVTSDHGNAEQMIDPETYEPHTAHTTNLVPFMLIDDDFRGRLRAGGALEDIAPTVLGILHIPQPEEMTGKDLRTGGSAAR